MQNCAARGVLMLEMLDAPLLLVPSRDFVDVEEKAPEHPFAVPRSSIASLLSEGVGASWPHRVRVVGKVTFQDAESFFIQDDSGGIRVRTSGPPRVNVGETVDVLGFPMLNGFDSLLERSIRASN